MSKQELSAVFERFVGREVKVVESSSSMTIDNEVFDIRDVRTQDGDETLQELREAAGRNGLRLRVWTPGMVATMDFDPQRLNIHVEKAPDGKYRVKDNMHLDGGSRLFEGFDSIVERGMDWDVSVMRPLKLKAPGA